MHDDILHAVSIPAYETHRWKEDSCSPNLDRVQTEFNCSAAALRCHCSFAKSVLGPFRVTVLAFALQPGKNHGKPCSEQRKGGL